MSSLQAILFDFDDTLSHEAGSFAQALGEVAASVAQEHGFSVSSLVNRVQELAREDWRASRYWRTKIALGVSSSEVFSGGFKQGQAGAILQAESERIRPVVWRRALAELGISDGTLVERLSQASRQKGTGQHPPYPGVVESLSTLSQRFPLGLVTNGNPDIQRRKLARSGLERFFNTVVVSGDPGLETMKPDPATFQRALSSLNAEAESSLMIGNDPVNDIHGAASIGMMTVWVDFAGNTFKGPTAPDHEIRDMSELPGLVDTLT